jgi:hypothetical protein
MDVLLYDDNKSQININNKNISSVDANFEEYSCLSCKYKTCRKDNYNRHLQSEKHIDKISLKENSHMCFLCNYKCSKKSNYNVHLTSKKHIQNMKLMEEKEMNKNIISNVETFKNEIISKLMNQMDCILDEKNKNILAEQTQTRLMVESQTKLMREIANKPNTLNTLNDNRISNQQFNMNVFLNETCKDAMNLSEFIENLQVSMEDMEKTGELGFAKGMSRIIMNNLNSIDVCKRPIHCSDVKRETLYVKNNGVWEKETEERKRTKEIIYKVSCLNTRQLLKWRDLPRNKGYEKSDHKKNDEFTKLVMEINKLRDEEIDKVITTVSKHVAIDKDKIKMSGYLN